MVKKKEEPIRGLELIMWFQGQWEALEKTAPNGANRQTSRQTDTRTWQLYDWIRPVGPIQWKSLIQETLNLSTTKDGSNNIFLLPLKCHGSANSQQPTATCLSLLTPPLSTIGWSKKKLRSESKKAYTFLKLCHHRLILWIRSSLWPTEVGVCNAGDRHTEKQTDMAISELLVYFSFFFVDIL